MWIEPLLLNDLINSWTWAEQTRGETQNDFMLESSQRGIHISGKTCRIT